MKRAFVLSVCSLLLLGACGLEAGESLSPESLGTADQRAIVLNPGPIIILNPVDAGTAPVDAGTPDAGTGCVVTAVPPMPTVQTTPIKVSAWPTTRPYIPATSGSAYVSVYRSPTDKTQFVAYGFDVRNAQMLFFVTGDRATEQDAFTSTIRVEQSKLPLLTGSVGAGTALFIQADVPIPPRPTPGINDPDLLRANFVWTMSASTHHFMADAQEYGQKTSW
jgi:hypothetical protein